MYIKSLVVIRFYNDGLWRKRLTMVDFNNELDLESVVKSKSNSVNPRYSRFKLYAVSNHYGTMDAGHYTAYCKNPEYNKWFKFDDQEVMEINGNEVRSAAAYILFYTAIDYQAPPVIQNWKSHPFLFHELAPPSIAKHYKHDLFLSYFRFVYHS